MKKSISILSVAFILLIVFSCKKDDNNPSNNLSENVIQGNWKVALFNDNGNDETNDFAAFQFQFNTGGIVVATNQSASFNGTWTTGSDDSHDKLILDFGSTTPLNELNEDWEVLECSAMMLRLVHVSGGNGGMDCITFNRI